MHVGVVVTVKERRTSMGAWQIHKGDYAVVVDDSIDIIRKSESEDSEVNHNAGRLRKSGWR